MSQAHPLPRPRLSRRAFIQLGGLAGLGLVSGTPSLNTAVRASTAAPYRALVCVYLTGGNDGNNLLVPLDDAAYGQYLAARGGRVGSAANGALALPHATEPGGVLPLAGTRYGLHPAMPELRALWDAGQVAMVLNNGNLVRPYADAADFAARGEPGSTPEHLFSHLDQCHQALMTSLGPSVHTGWAGRLADFVPVPAASLPVGISAAGNTLFLGGQSSTPLVVPQSGAMNYNFFSADAPSQARLAALKTLLGNAHESDLINALAAQQGDALDKGALLQSVLGGDRAAAMAAHFPRVATSPLAQQLVQVALLIEAATSGALPTPAQQIFYVELGGFDTHDAQLATHAALLAELSQALSGFMQAMARIGQADQVVAFTLSDFGRTMLPTSNGGSDHGWGSHQIVVGGRGAVRPGLFGDFPDLRLGGRSDVCGRGRWLPGTSVDQYGATLARWLGAPPEARAAAFPNLAHFAIDDLAFLR